MRIWPGVPLPHSLARYSRERLWRVHLQTLLGMNYGVIKRQDLVPCAWHTSWAPSVAKIDDLQIVSIQWCHWGHCWSGFARQWRMWGCSSKGWVATTQKKCSFQWTGKLMVGPKAWCPVTWQWVSKTIGMPDATQQHSHIWLLCLKTFAFGSWCCTCWTDWFWKISIVTCRLLWQVLVSVFTADCPIWLTTISFRCALHMVQIVPWDSLGCNSIKVNSLQNVLFWTISFCAFPHSGTVFDIMKLWLLLSKLNGFALYVNHLQLYVDFGNWFHLVSFGSYLISMCFCVWKANETTWGNDSWWSGKPMGHSPQWKRIYHHQTLSQLWFESCEQRNGVV